MMWQTKEDLGKGQTELISSNNSTANNSKLKSRRLSLVLDQVVFSVYSNMC